MSLPGLLFASYAQQPANDTAHLERASDRSAFLRWFTFLAEAQSFLPAAQRATEVVDCSALLRYAYREALRRHDATWAAQIRAPLIPAIPSVEQYNYPRTPTGPNIFRVGPHSYAQFADAGTLVRYNASFVSRDLLSGRAGDLLFYRNASQRVSFHSMIVVGRSQITTATERFIVYDTGPEGTNEGEIKRLSFDELLHFPDARWQPTDRNRSFLGVYRWNIVN